MEPRSAFDLDGAVAVWRANLVAQDTINRDVLEELEMHLRDTVSDLHTSGLTTREAFWVAYDRLGHAEALAVEFEKVSRAGKWRKRLAWGVAGYLTAVTAQLVTRSAGALGTLAAVGIGAEDFAVPVLTFAAKAGALGGLAWAGYVLAKDNSKRFRRLFQSMRRKTSLVFVTVAGVVLLPLLSVVLPVGAQVVLARIMDVRAIGELAMFTQATSLAWSVFLPIAGFIVIFWLLRPSADIRTA